MPAKRTTSRKPSSPSTNASEVEPGVFVGGWADAVDFQGARFCVLDKLSDEPVPAEAHLPIYDPATDRPIRANLDRIAELAITARTQGKPVLFFCGHGVRRGPLATAWFLHRSEGVLLAEAYTRIRAVRPKVETARQWAGDVSVLDDSDRPSRS
jgi:hypothetical protein